jgi:hypothetical protein
VSPGEKSRDWDKEMAEIDKILAAEPAGPPASPVPAGKAARAPAAPAPGAAPARPGGLGKYARLFTWVRLTLGLLLGAAMTQWPYTHGCGLPLFAYLGGVLAVLVAALWSTVSSWKTRSGFAHALSLGLFVWGGFLAAREILPRVGYAKEAAEWTCTTVDRGQRSEVRP